MKVMGLNPGTPVRSLPPYVYVFSPQLFFLYFLLPPAFVIGELVILN